jgi:lipopolysaccharide transport system ATP-binding protein
MSHITANPLEKTANETFLGESVSGGALAPSTPGNEVVIRLQGVSKKYNLYDSRQDRLKEALHPRRKKYHRDFYALNNINLNVAKGEVLGIVGKNGSGKSTLLKVISGILTPTSGSVDVKGKMVPLLELGAGFNPEFTGIENIFFYGTILGFTKADMEGRIDGILDFADLGEFIYQPVKVYSSGMKSRLAFSVATEINPDILIVDEVLAVGDAVFQRKCYARIETMFKDGKTVIMVSHNRNSIVALCQRAILLDAGGLVAEGDAGAVVREYEKLCNREFLADLSENNEATKITTTEESDIQPEGTENDKEMVFDNSLIDRKPLYYKKSKVTFEHFALYNKENTKINVLKPGDQAIVRAGFSFQESLSGITFALRIRSIQGLIMSWTGFPFEKRRNMSFAEGERLDIELEFDCNFLEGVYSMDTALQSIEESDIFFHIGVGNVYMFEVKKNPQINYFGPVFLGFRDLSGCQSSNSAM